MTSETDVPVDAPATGAALGGFKLVSLLTLLSRVLGLVRDMGMAALFGNGPVMDAFSVAFRIPNLARRMFGEGALTAAFLPVYVRLKENGELPRAWQLTSVVFAGLIGTLSLAVIVGEVLIGVWLLRAGLNSETRLLLELTAILLPYVVLICLGAQISAVLHAWDHFGWPAFLPVLLNLIWIGGILAAPLFESPETQVRLVSWCILAAGIVQAMMQLPTLRRLGYAFQWDWAETRGLARTMLATMVPILLGLSITQLNTLLDGVMAWYLSQPHPDWPIPLPLFSEGTASALYFGQRLYQFPLGVFGVALGTVMFPRLARHAEQQRPDLFRQDLTTGLELVLCLGIPAGAGLVLLAAPLAELFFQYGAFDSEDARQTQAMIAGYSWGVWAYCAVLILSRAFYALGNQTTPLRVGLVSVGCNVLLNVLLIYPLGGTGLAVASSLASMIQAVGLTLAFQQLIGPLHWRPILTTLLKTLAATAGMCAAGWLTLQALPGGDRVLLRALRVTGPFLMAMGSFALLARLLRLDAFWLLLRRHRRAGS